MKSLRFGLASFFRNQAGLWLALMLLALWPVFGGELILPPEFDSGYMVPMPTAPSPRVTAMEYVDVAVLFAALCLASWFVLGKRSRKHILGLMLFSLVYFGFYRHGCICAIGSIQDVTLALFNPGYVVPLSVAAFFLLPLAFTLVFGRTFCAAVCPLGALQDVFLLRPVKVVPWLENALGIFPFFYLGAAILFAATGTAFIICEYDFFVAFFRRTGPASMLIWGGVWLSLGIFIGRPYCRFLCPYGAILRVFSRFAKWKVTLTPRDCIHCQLCEVACAFGAIAEPSVHSAAASQSPSSKKRTLAGLAIPLLLAGGVWLGAKTGMPFSKHHPTVALAEEIAAEESGKPFKDATDASKAFRQLGRPVTDLYVQALRIRNQFDFGGKCLGAFAGLLLGVNLFSLFWTRRRQGYEPDPGPCLACGRCYAYCPKEIVRLKAFESKKDIRLSSLQRPMEPARKAAANPEIWKTGANNMAVIAGAFCGIVAVLLSINLWQSRSFDPIKPNGISAMKEGLVKDPRNEILKKAIRAADLGLRQDLARHQALSEQGAWLLMGGFAVLLVALKPALHRKKLPRPNKITISPEREQRLAAQAAGAVVLFGTLGAAALLMADSHPAAYLDEVLVNIPKGTQSLETRHLASQSDVASPMLTRYASAEDTARNWPRFRGPGGLGISNYTNVPSAWNLQTGENVLWKTPVPVMGPNSPVIWDNRLFLTGATATKREVFCFDALTGKLVWRKSMTDIYNPHRGDLVVSKEYGGYSASTAATDGRRLYVLFANGDVGALDFDGNIVWSMNMGTPDNSYGHATSLDTYQDRLLVLFDQAEARSGKSRLLCFEGATGKKVWESAPRPVGQSWATPIQFRTADRDQIITCGNPWIVSYNPATGMELWRAKALKGDVTPSPVYANDMLYVAVDGEALSAFKVDGSGDVTATHKAWSFPEGLPDVCSPLCDGLRVYLLNSSGTLTVVDAIAGKKLYEQEFDFTYKVSPSLAGDRVYLCGDQGMVVVCKAASQYTEIARSDIGEELLASPSFASGRIYIRGAKTLFCFGATSK